MNKSTIDNIIEVFDNSYHVHKKELYNKYHSLDKFIELSREYVNGLEVTPYQKDVFETYFKAHVISMYRRDFEKEIMGREFKKYSLTKKDTFIIYTSWGGLFGTLGLMMGYSLQSYNAEVIGSIVGVVSGLLFAHMGMPKDHMKKNILGTKEYEAQILKGLYKALSNS